MSDDRHTTVPGISLDTYPPLRVEVVRNGFVESCHVVRAAVVRADGSLVRFGDVDGVVLPRSSNKPLQAAGMLHLGLRLPADLLAAAAASHSAESFHVAAARRILAGQGLDDGALQCPPDLPFDEAAKAAALADGPKRVYMNCSGKHAAMVATCRINGWPIESYRDPRHPLQLGIRATVEELAGESVRVMATDGCGAPIFGLSLAGLAHAFSLFGSSSVPVGDASPDDERRSPSRSDSGSMSTLQAAATVAAAMRAHPDMVSGTTRDELAVMRGVPGILLKSGAEGVDAMALADGTAIALKVDDGSARARPVARAALLQALGVDAPILREQGAPPVLGCGEPVGSLRVDVPSLV